MKRLILVVGLLLMLVPVFAASGLIPFIVDLHIPGGLVFGPDDQLYIAEWGAVRVCKYDAYGRRTLVTDQVGRPSGLAFDEAGTLYIASYDQGVIYALDPRVGEVPKPIAGGFSVPAGLLWTDDSLYVANRDAGEIVRLERSGPAWTKTVVSRGLSQPVAIWKRSDGSLVISSLTTGPTLIDALGATTMICSSIQGSGINIIPDGQDAFIVSVINEGSVERITSHGERTVLAAGFSTPLGLARHSDGALVVATWGEGVAFVLVSGQAEHDN